ncbi:hypothetical protein [Pollutibacter soli]|uniref:hypothetical protein n=1 Tax=Pollutibacter soli TaxID=3034157 RepID=UPI003013B432
MENVNKSMGRLLFLICALLGGNPATAQCNVVEKVLPDGTMYYHAETLLFYKTKDFQLSGNLVTDKEHYFLSLKPLPFPEKSKNIKIKSDLVITLTNNTAYTLKLFDTYYYDKDSSFAAVYMFDAKNLPDFRTHEVKEVKLDLGEGFNNYIFRLHKEALREQLDCFKNTKNKF